MEKLSFKIMIKSALNAQEWKFNKEFTNVHALQWINTAIIIINSITAVRIINRNTDKKK